MKSSSSDRSESESAAAGCVIAGFGALVAVDPSACWTTGLTSVLDGVVDDCGVDGAVLCGTGGGLGLSRSICAVDTAGPLLGGVGPGFGPLGVGRTDGPAGAGEAPVGAVKPSSGPSPTSSPLLSLATILPNFANSSLLALDRAALWMITESHGCRAAAAFTR